MGTCRTTRSSTSNQRVVHDKRVSRLITPSKEEEDDDRRQDKDFSKFEELKRKALPLLDSGIGIDDRLWASRLADSFDTSNEQKKLILKVFIASIKWGL